MQCVIFSICAALVLLAIAEALVPADGQVPRRLGFKRRLCSFQSNFGTNMRIFYLQKGVVSSSECIVEAKNEYQGEEESQPKPNLLPLFLVPLVWGTYSPIVKSIYSTSSVLPPPVLVFNFLSYLVSFSSLLLAGLSRGHEQSSRVNEAGIRADSLERDNLEPRVGVELGMYLFVGSMLQVYGIQMVSATKAAVLVQCTTILVPLLESQLYRKKLSKKLWAACCLALLGVLRLTLDNPGTWLQSQSEANGDLAIIGATFFYSMHVVRLSNFAARTKPLRLAQYKSGTELAAATAALSVSFLLAFLLPKDAEGGGYGAGAEIWNYFKQLHNLPSLLSQSPVLFGILWNGTFATALTTYLQTLGQRNVAATTANVIYSSQPIWASLLSYIFLQERLAPENLLGTAILASAVLLAATDTRTQ